MGLFRRGTKLLRLGSGLRDCCCRPEKPEECWCPDWCRYYWDWGGGLRIAPATDGGNTPCLDLDSVSFDAAPPPGMYGIGDSSIESGFALPANLSRLTLFDFNGPRVTYRSNLYFPFSQETAVALGFTQDCMGPDTYVEYLTVFSVWFRCEYFSGQPVLQVFADLQQAVVAVVGQYFSYACGITLLNSYKSATINLPSNYSSCETDSRLTCGDRVVRGLHLNQDISIGVGAGGVKIDGTVYDWETDSTERNDVVDWEVEGEYPLSSETYDLTLKRLDSCQPGPCDCNTSIIGRRVLFEGREFTVGDLDTILGTSIEHDGQSYWEEVSAGSFRRTDYETCGDGSYVRRVKQATVSCSDFAGVERWYVILDHICYDRDPEECLPGFTATRERTWTGYFSCTDEGKPLGMPKGENGLGDPELVFDFTNGTIEHGCVDEQGCCGFGGSGIPFISFPNPDF